MRAPISIVIPTLNSQKTIKKTLVSLFEGIEAGIVRELIVVDGGSSDKTKEIVLACGGKFIASRALANKPKIILADEPTGNLDQNTTLSVFETLLKIVKKTNLAALIATHNLDLAKRMDRVVKLIDGKIS